VFNCLRLVVCAATVYAAEEATTPSLESTAMDVDTTSAAVAAAADAVQLLQHQSPSPSSAVLHSAADTAQNAASASITQGALIPPSQSGLLPAAAEGPVNASGGSSSSSGMPVQNIGLVMQLHRRWMVYQLQQMGRAAMSPLSTAKRAVRLHGWEEHRLVVIAVFSAVLAISFVCGSCSCLS
jgi:hypothetical protein